MKSRILTVLILSAIFTIFAAELIAGIVVLKSGHRLQGRILKEDERAVLVGYKDGWLKIPRRNVDRTVQVRELSDYGKQGLMPSEDELLQIEEAAIKASGMDVSEQDKGETSLNVGELITTRHSIENDEQTYVFELPMSWTSETTGNITVFSSPGEGLRPCATVVTLDTPRIKTDEQVGLTEAAMKTELGGFKLIYARCRTEGSAESAACMLSGMYGSQKQGVIVKTILRKARKHTLAINFFIPAQLYHRYKSLPGACEKSLQVHKAGK